MLGLPASSHDDTRGARFVDPGNTVKVAAGIYDMSGVEPESFLFGVNHAQGGYEPGGHFDRQDPDAYPTILVGVDSRYRQALMRLGFKWAADFASGAAGHRGRQPGSRLAGDRDRRIELCPGIRGSVPLPQCRFAVADFTESIHEPAAFRRKRLGLRRSERRA